jgi:hypothetical protein
LGIAPGANINYVTGHAIFEATHGTARAPDDWSDAAQVLGVRQGDHRQHVAKEAAARDAPRALELKERPWPNRPRALLEMQAIERT